MERAAFSVLGWLIDRRSGPDAFKSLSAFCVDKNSPPRLKEFACEPLFIVFLESGMKKGMKKLFCVTLFGKAK